MTPADRYLLDPALKHPRNSRVSAGVDYAFSPRYRVNATYRYIRGDGLLRGLNLNAPVDGVRPSPEFGNVIQVVGDGRCGSTSGISAARRTFRRSWDGQRARWDFRRFNFFGNYTLAWNENNTDGPFSVPATGDLDLEWGNAASPREAPLQRRVSHAGVQGPRPCRSTSTATSAPTYGIQTGYDDNGDLIFNDRPAGIARNTLLTDPRPGR